MTLVSPKWLAIIGTALLVAGALWGAFFYGVPYQDPTPAQAAREQFHSTVSGWAMGSGLVLLGAGVLRALVRWLARLGARRS